MPGPCFAQAAVHCSQQQIFRACMPPLSAQLRVSWSADGGVVSLATLGRGCATCMPPPAPTPAAPLLTSQRCGHQPRNQHVRAHGNHAPDIVVGAGGQSLQSRHGREKRACVRAMGCTPPHKRLTGSCAGTGQGGTPRNEQVDDGPKHGCVAVAQALGRAARTAMRKKMTAKHASSKRTASTSVQQAAASTPTVTCAVCTNWGDASTLRTKRHGSLQGQPRLAPRTLGFPWGSGRPARCAGPPCGSTQIDALW
jgi:hypothetical protein